MARVFLRGGVWYIDWTDELGKRRKRATKARTKREAEQLLRELVVQADRRRHGLAPSTPNVAGLTLAVLLRRHLEAMAPTTRRRAVGLLERWVMTAPVADLPIERVTTADLEQLAEAAAAKLKPRTVNKIRTHVHAAYERARKLGWWTGANPAARVTIRKAAPHAFDVFDADEIPRILAAIETRGGAAGAWRADLCAIAVYHGPRRGELVALRAEWVNLEAGFVAIRGSHDRDTPKSGKVRELPIYDAVRPYYERALARVGPTGLLFPSPRGGGRLNRDLHCAAWIRRACADCGIEKNVRFHDLRHTAATAMLEGGLDVVAVAAILGHASVLTTERIYGHTRRKYLAREIAKMNTAAPTTTRAKGGS